MGLYSLLQVIGFPASTVLFGWVGTWLGGRAPIMLAGVVTAATAMAATAWLARPRRRLATRLPDERAALDRALNRIVAAFARWHENHPHGACRRP
jgi:hypothetical protein